MQNICLFVHFSEGNEFPGYVRKYVLELSRHFQEVKLLSNPGKITSHSWSSNVELVFHTNVGYDFGRIYTYLHSIDLHAYDNLAIVNDSNWLIGDLQDVLDWDSICKYDLWGIIDSHEKPWYSNHTDSYHLQSHFLILGRKAINHLDTFFKQAGVHEIMTEKDAKTLRRMVIDRWEIGLTQFMLSKGLITGSYINSFEFNRRFGHKLSANATHLLFEELIREGYPLLKRKAILNSTGMDSLQINENHPDEILSYFDRELGHPAIIKHTDSILPNPKYVILKYRFVEFFKFGKKAINKVTLRLPFSKNRMI